MNICLNLYVPCACRGPRRPEEGDGTPKLQHLAAGVSCHVGAALKY